MIPYKYSIREHWYLDIVWYCTMEDNIKNISSNDSCKDGILYTSAKYNEIWWIAGLISLFLY